MNTGRQSFSPLSVLTAATSSVPFSRRRLLAVTLLGLLAVTCLFALSGTGGATVADGQYAHGGESDDEPPGFGNGSRINDTAIAVTISDNHDVDESTIEASDFLLSHGSIRNVSVSEDGSDATATLLLTRRINQDNVTVVLQSDATILDTNGNALDSSASDSFVIVPNMDGVPPALEDFSVTNATGGPATIRIEAREALSDFHLTLNGPASDTLDRSDFETVDNGKTWETTYSPPADGTYVAYMNGLTDEAGNTRESSRNRRFVADLTPPDAVAALDLANSQNLSIAFDASQSSDENGIEQYSWEFGDGNTATGPRVANDFLPGNYTVRLNVTDIYGNTAGDTITLNLTRGSGDADAVSESELRERVGGGLNVSVDRRGGLDSSDAFVGVDNARRNESVAVGTLDSDDELARYGPVSLDGIEVTLATNRSFDLGLSMTGNESVRDAAVATEAMPLAGFTVVNTVADEEIANANIQFSVDQSRLRALDVSPADVSLYRYHDGRWNAVPTRALNATNETQPFRAESPGFSRFAITADTATNSNIVVTDATVETPQVASGDTFSVTATVENSGDFDGAFTGGLEANGTLVSTATTSVAAGETATLSLQSQPSDEGTYTLSVNGTAAGTVDVTPTTTDTNSDADTSDRQFVVTNASLGTQQVDVDEVFSVEATVENRGAQPDNFTAGLAVNGSVVVVTETSPIPPGDSQTVELDYLLNRSGAFHISVNGTSAGTLTVGDVGDGDDTEDGGPLAQLAGVLGVLPMGLLQPIFLFVVLPIALIYGLLKALAIYLGY
ncbi:PGF-pre-PGF domain-containing protein [Salinibaculum salinum]|uniref:PGF-pre-PGF domain-containing protein n=1 Tax=Salinibaculum salinum TaxID=3131996 RepID=UPI0030EC232B